MSADISKSRQQLGQVRSLLRQKKPQPAVNNVYAALVLLVKAQLMKAEREEFEELLADATAQLASDPTIRAMFPLQISYAPGREGELMDKLRDLLATFDSTIMDAAKLAHDQMEARKLELLRQGNELGEAANHEAMLELAEKAAQEFKEDAVFIGKLGEMCLKFALYKEAIAYLSRALTQNPEYIFLYAQIGVALRKIKDFETAEKYYMQATELVKSPNLYFNLGRLYIDWQKWDKAILAAQEALLLQPDFEEAQKMITYAQKQMSEPKG